MESATQVDWFTEEELDVLKHRISLDEMDRKILIIKLTQPRLSNAEIGKLIGTNRIQVWYRLQHGPLGRLWLELQKEAISSAQDSVIANALDAVRALGELARGTCDCPESLRTRHENEGTPHRLLCLTPVPYAVRRAAAKDLVDILKSKGFVDGEKSQEEEVWEAAITEIGGVRVKQIPAGGKSA